MKKNSGKKSRATVPLSKAQRKSTCTRLVFSSDLQKMPFDSANPVTFHTKHVTIIKL